jgi:type VI secretion system secreted protein Hcp
MRLWTIAAAAAAVLVPALAMTSAAHAEMGYLSIKGQKTGDIKGDVMQKGHDGWNSVLSMEYGISSPTDLATGMASGRRTHQPISFTLRWSKATPLLLGALTNNETLSDVQFQRWQPDPDGSGAELNTDTIQLSNARIASLKIVDQKADDGKLDTVVIVTMTYRQLTVMHQPGGVMAEDSWSAVQ